MLYCIFVSFRDEIKLLLDHSDDKLLGNSCDPDVNFFNLKIQKHFFP